MRAILGQYRAAIAEPNEYMKYYLEEDTVYVLMSGLSGTEDEYRDGEYLLKFRMPDDYPFNPPHFTVYTPNGRYTIDTENVCISLGKFHKSDYKPVLGIGGFAHELMLGLLIPVDVLGDGFGIMHESTETRRELAARSHTYNLEHHRELMVSIYQNFVDYSSRWNAASWAGYRDRALRGPRELGMV